MNPAFEFCSVSKNYQHQVVLSDVSFSISTGGHTAILGPSGCGKSTVLRILSGLDVPSAGEVLQDGKVISQTNQIIIPPHRRGIAMVFQDLALWPNLSVLENVLLGQTESCLGRQGIIKRAEKALAMCRIEKLAKRFPAKLSGGQQQRVALSRAIATKPSFLFLDEPFSGLDLVLKTELLREIEAFAEQNHFTILLVTHDPIEVATLCNSAIVLEQGKVVELGELEGLLQKPKSKTLRIFRKFLNR